MISAFDRTFKLGLQLSVIDWLTFNVVFLLSHYFKLIPPFDTEGSFLTHLTVANIAYVIALQFVTISLHHRQSQPAKVLNNTSRTSVLFIVLYTSILGIFTHAEIPGVWASLLLTIAVFLVTSVERLFLRTSIIRRRSSGHDTVKAIIVGTGEMAQRAVNVMTNGWNGYDLLGYFADEEDETLVNPTTNEKIPYLGDRNDIIKFIEKHNVDELYINVTPRGPVEFKELMQSCDKNMVRVYYIPLTIYGEFRKAKVKEFGDIYVLSQYDEPLRDIRNRIKKRIFDFTVSLLFLCTVFPFILIVVFIVSKITMPGPLFFKQKRTGYDGRDFWCYKFRSMKVNKDSDKVQAVKNDPRITKWGAFMRHSNIDELPQFINVLIGNMSLVGPRPHMLAHTDYYSELISDYMIRHYVKPGITGWAQTHGERGETKTVEDMRRRVEKDIWYIEHWSFWLDIQIMMKTVSDAIHGDDKAY